MSGKVERDHWHPGFLGAMELEFTDYKQDLIFDGEYQLSKEPLKMDLLIIKKRKDVVIENQIGKIFRTYNIFEFKSPRDGLTIDDYIKTVGYTYLYKGLGKHVDEIPFSELTVTLVRDKKPEGLFKSIKSLGGTIEEKYPGIFYINGIVNIPTQFVSTNSLDAEEHITLRLLSEDAQEKDVERFLLNASRFKDPVDRNNLNALLSVSVSANKQIFQNVTRRGEIMSDALSELLEEILQDKIVEKEQKAVDNTWITAIKNLMDKEGWDSGKAMDAIGVSSADQIRYSAMLQ